LLPASTEFITGINFAFCGLSQIDFEADNPFFHSKGDFVVDSKEVKVIRYFGRDSHVTIPACAEVIGEACFDACDSVIGVDFGRESKVSLIEMEAFRSCSHLEWIHIPLSVRSVGESAFYESEALVSILFDPNAQLSDIGEDGFNGCIQLKSITIPSSVEIIGVSCFSYCEGLTTITFHPDSKLIRIGSSAFRKCVSLRPFYIPSSVECIEAHCFAQCFVLSELLFSVPCHLRELLSLPPKWAGFVDIPDSVERLEFEFDDENPSVYTLTFGRESKLKEIRAHSSGSRSTCPRRSLLLVSSGCLQALRRHLEFEI
jgi:hypothetical protein